MDDLGALGVKKPTDIAWDGSKLFVLDEDTDALYTIHGIELPEPPKTTSRLQTKQIGDATRFGFTRATLSSPRGIAMINDDLYMVEDNTDFLYTIDRETGVAGTVGSAGLSKSSIQPRGLAWDGSNLYMLTPDSLYKIVRAYGTASLVGSLGTGITDAFGLAWDGEKLYMADRATDALYTLSTSTGAASRVNSKVSRFGERISNPSGLVWVGPPASEIEGDNELPSLYMGDNRGYLYKVDKETGSASYEGWLGKGDVTGLAWFDETSTLYYVNDTTDALNTVTNFPKFLPNAGDLYYNGSNFADGFIRWDNPSWVQQGSQCKNDPNKCSTYEHDLKLEWKNSGGWYNVDPRRRVFVAAGISDSPFCTTWSDFPVNYDDCITAGVGSSSGYSYETDGTVELSFGTSRAPLIEAGRDYYGFWIFKNQREAGSTTEVRLYGQEGKLGRGPLYNTRCLPLFERLSNLWCVEGRQQGSLLESGAAWSYGTPSYTAYSRP